MNKEMNKQERERIERPKEEEKEEKKQKEEKDRLVIIAAAITMGPLI